MPLPVRVDHPYERQPWGTYGLIAANALVFLWAQSASEADLLEWVLRSNDVRFSALFTSCFLHLGLVHLVGNMVFLAVFGRYVEARIGAGLLVGLYLACGLAGSLVFLGEAALVYDTPRAVIGASGAIAGLMGWTLIAAPRAEVRVFLWWAWHAAGHGLPALSAWFVLGGWIVWQLLLWVFAGPYLKVAFAAHFGGLLAGGAIAWWMHHAVTKGTIFHVERALAGGSQEDAKRARTAQKWKALASARREALEAQRAHDEALAREAEAAREDDPIEWPPARS